MSAPARTRDERGEAQAPERRCLVTGEVRPRAELIRFVVSPEGRVLVDLEGGLPGRGMWLCARRDVVETACAKGLFAKAARRPVAVEPGLADALAERLARRCLDLLGLANRAGELVLGFEKVRALIERGRAKVLIAARDASPEGKRKLRARAGGAPLVEAFDCAQLSRALGRENVVHVALAPGRLAERFLAEATRYAGFAAEAAKGAGVKKRES